MRVKSFISICFGVFECFSRIRTLRIVVSFFDGAMAFYEGFVLYQHGDGLYFVEIAGGAEVLDGAFHFVGDHIGVISSAMMLVSIMIGFCIRLFYL